MTEVVDDGKTYLKAEIGLWRAIALSKVDIIRPAVIAVVAALMLVQAGLTVVTAGFGMALAKWVGVPGGLALAGLLLLVIAAALALFAVARLKALGR